MATTTPLSASEVPLDLEVLKKSASTNYQECVLIRNSDLDDITGKPSPGDRASFPMKALGLVLELGQTIIEAEITDLHANGVKMIAWQPVVGQINTQKKSLWNSNRAGMWNHLIFPVEKEKIGADLLEFALNNPNIVNSYSFDGKSIAPPPATLKQLIKSLARYLRIESLPGIPIWKFMDTPEQLLCFLNKFGIQQVQKWLVKESTSKVHQLGNSIRYFYVQPHDLPDNYFEDICRMVEAGGSVDMNKVRYNLKRAFLIGYAMEFGLIVGNSSLKQPRSGYIQSLNQNTGLDFSGFLERGYTSVRPEYRGMGMGTKLLEGLTKRTQGKRLYSIITEDNLATQKIAIRNKTRKVATFFSQKTGKQVGVWVKD